MVASAQHGAVARSQLLSLGLSSSAIEHRLACGRLRSLYPGVYSVGHDAIGPRGRVAAALLAASWFRAGPGAKPSGPVAASHLTAAALWGLSELGGGLLHVTSVQRRRRLSGLVIHRGVLPEDELARRDDLPVTTVARTLLDLSGMLEVRSLRRMVKDAEYRGLVGLDAMTAILQRYPRRRGRRRLTQIVHSRVVGAGRTRSDLEDRFLMLCRGHSVPLPETNVTMEVGGEIFQIDCLWRRERVAVELDSFRGHGTRLAFESDRARDRTLAAAGWLPLRVTAAQLDSAPERVFAELRAALRSRTSGRLAPRPRGGGAD